MTEHRTIESGFRNRIDNVRNPVKDLRTNDDIRYRLELLESEVKRIFDAERREPRILYDTAGHLLEAGGKHLRSLLMMLGAEAVGAKLTTILPYAVAAELIQTASLIHDDIIDEDETRRGVESTHIKFGNKLAVIAGDLLIGIAVKLIGETVSPEMLALVASTGIQMCEGEVFDFLLLESMPQVMTKDEYFEVVRQKSVSFIESSVRVGAIIGKASKEDEEVISEYGKHLGYAFQIRDDILDATMSEENLGKSPRSDIGAIRCNYLLIHALESSSEDGKRRALEELEQGNIEPILGLIAKTGAIEHAVTLSRDYANRARRVIEGRGFINEHLLLAIIDFAIERDH